jgi:FkbM family methyltransferase
VPRRPRNRRTVDRTRATLTSFVDRFRRDDRRNVIAAYQSMLGRPPENRETIERFNRIGIPGTLHAIAGSAEFRSLHEASPFFYYNASFDVRATLHRHAASDLAPHPDYLTNYLGVRIDPRFLPGILDGRAGEVEGIPVPSNWHADMAEWAAALRAVELARKHFTMVELGCGWGCWINNTGVAAKAVGLTVDLIGVEGNAEQLAFAREAYELNGFDSTQVTLRHGIAAESSGSALFPRRVKRGTEWGSAPVFARTEAERAAAVAAGTHEEVPMVALNELLGERVRVDLLHLDIQGGEADLIESSRGVLDQRVAYLVIGTHSREIEGRLLTNLLRGSWQLEVERPAILDLEGNAPATTIDGVQGWRNRALSRD